MKNNRYMQLWRIYTSQMLTKYVAFSQYKSPPHRPLATMEGMHSLSRWSKGMRFCLLYYVDLIANRYLDRFERVK